MIHPRRDDKAVEEVRQWVKKEAGVRRRMRDRPSGKVLNAVAKVLNRLHALEEVVDGIDLGDEPTAEEPVDSSP